MRSNPLPEEFYRHFKGKLYQIKCIAWHSETGEPMVIYQAMYGTYKTYARPLTMFMEEVDHVKYPDVTQKYRFEKVELTDKQESELCPAFDLTSDAKILPQETETANSLEIGQDSVKNLQESAENFQVLEEQSQVTEEHTQNLGEIPPTVAERSQDPVENPQEPSEIPLDPKIIEFLDARTYDEKLTILSSIHHRLTDDMIDIMSTATDIEVKPGNIEDRYEEFKSCLVTMQHFECNRLH